MRAHPRGTEWVTVTNTSGDPVDLFGYRLYSRPYQYAFGPGTVLAAGASLRVSTRGTVEQDAPGRLHWALPKRVLNDGGDRVEVQTFDQISLACDAWGSKRCG